jgi:hypothetical protein
MFKSAISLGLLLVAAQSAIAGDLTLYSKENFRGRELILRASSPNLAEAGFNDRASSMMVRSGRWELCSEPGFAGKCLVFEKGQYAELNRMDNRISSVRELDEERGGHRGEHGRGPDRDGDGRRDGPRGHDEIPRVVDPSAGVVLFQDERFQGRFVALRGDTNDFNRVGFNDAASSMVIQHGTWEFCIDSNFRGQCLVLGPGQYRMLDPMLRNSISSARQVGQAGRPQSEVELFSGPDFRGQKVVVRQDLDTLRALDFNDKAGSVIIHGGRWELCKHGDFKGPCVVYGPGRYGNLGPLNNEISSLRRVR